MTSKFKKIGIMGRLKTPRVLDTLKALIQLLVDLKQPFCLDSETAQFFNDKNLTHYPGTKISQHCDLLIVVGGDGSMLHAAHTIIQNHAIPVLGINRGRLGFLTDILPKELMTIKNILEGHYTIEKRFLLSAKVEYKGNIIGEGNALNEVALVPDSIPHMNEFEIYIDQQFVASQDSDGVIIATPTGSTAYALSGGGPILHPQLDAIVIVPMFPHTLSMRPIVIEANQTITIKIAPHNNATPKISCDSQSFISTPPGSCIRIFKKPEKLHLIHPIHYDYFETLRSKLHWGHKLPYQSER